MNFESKKAEILNAISNVSKLQSDKPLTKPGLWTIQERLQCISGTGTILKRDLKTRRLLFSLQTGYK